MTPTAQTRRSHERIWHTIAATLTTEGGGVIRGTTRDLSIRGVCLQVDKADTTLKVGERGRIQLELPGLANKSFACQIVYANTLELGIHIVKFTENFGLLLSQALFSEKQPDSKEVIDWSIVQVDIYKPEPDGQDGKTLAKGNVLRLTSDWIEFCCPPEEATPLLIGEEIMVHLTTAALKDYHIHIKGFIVEPLRLLVPKIGCPNLTHIKKVAFASNPSENIEWLVSLMRVVHAPRIAALIKNRAMNIALLSGEESAPPKRSDTLNHMRRFFGQWFVK